MKLTQCMLVLVIFGSPIYANVNTVPDLTVVTKQWFATSSGISQAVPCFRSQNDITPDVTNSLNRRCPTYPDPRPNNDSDPTDSMHNPADDSRIQMEYVYQLRIRNEGRRVIKAIVWEYVFSDPSNGRELTTHTFSNEIELMPGKTKTLTANSVRPPSKVITVQMLVNNVAGNYAERIRIRRIVYDDGSMWQS